MRMALAARNVTSLYGPVAATHKSIRSTVPDGEYWQAEPVYSFINPLYTAVVYQATLTSMDKILVTF